MRAGRLLCLACLVATSCLAQSAAAAHVAQACKPTIREVAHLQERIDTLLAVQRAHAVVALAGPRAPGVRFLPHDHLLLLTSGGRIRARIDLPSYTTPPGLAAGMSDRMVYVAVDGMLFRLDAIAARLLRRWKLDMQTLGWPGAAAMGTENRLYLVGQPHDASLPFAVVEAITIDRSGALHVLWRSPLGTTHAGIWLGLAGPDRLAVYLPDARDVSGTVTLLDRRTGSMRSAYPVPAPPVAVDASLNRLYVVAGGSILALSLADGRPVARAPGSEPVALDTRHGVLAFRRHDTLVMASAHTLRPLAVVPLPQTTALGYDVEGSALLAGFRTGLVRIDVHRCTAS